MKNFFTKNSNTKILNKVVSALVVFSFITAMVMPLKDAEAQVDAIGGPFQIFSTVFNEVKQIGLDTVLKQAAISMANNLLNQMIDSTANWVAGGFDGKPLFVQNPGQFFTNVASSSADEFLGRLQNGVFTGSKEWLKKVWGDAELKCMSDDIDSQTTNQYLDYLYGLLNPGMVGDFATGQENVSASAIRTFFDNNKPLTAQEIIQFASQNNFNNLNEGDIKMIDSFEVAAANSKHACECGNQAAARLGEQENIDAMDKEELASFLKGKGANVTVQSYLDEKFPIKSCIDFQNEDGNKPDFIAAGGYTRGIIQFLGQTYNDPKGTIQSMAPDYKGLPKEVQKEVSKNWTKFASANGTFAAGGWNSWNQYAVPNNNPLASKFLFKNAVKQQATYEVTKLKEELKDGNGFLGAKKCAVKEVKQPDGTTKCPTDQLLTTTPGAIVGDQLAKALNTPLAKTQNINSWGDVLSVALTRMATKLTTAGVTALTNEANRQMNIAKGTYAGIGGDILAKTSTTNNGAGTGASEVLDLEEFFLGKPVQKIKKDAQGQPMYEPVIDPVTGQQQVDQNGQPVYDTNKPIYVYEQQVDADGKPVFKTVVRGVNGKEPPLDPQTWNSSNTITIQEPVYDYTKPVYEEGFDFFLEGGRPAMEEEVAENSDLVTIKGEKSGEGKVKLTLSVPTQNAGIDLSKRVITWRDIKNSKVLKSERGAVTIEDTLDCPIGGCHNTYEATITDNKGGTIYKLISVWRNLSNGVVEWKTETSGSSEAAPISGELKIDLSKPLYMKDDQGNTLYEPTRDATGAIVVDANGNPVPDMTKPKRAPLRRGGAIARVYYMNWLLSKEREQIRQLPQAAKALDQCIPGPDYNWDKRLQAKYDKLTQKYGGKRPEQVNHILTPLKEIGQAVYTIMSGYQEGNPPEGCTGSKWVEPRNHEIVSMQAEKANAGTVRITLSSNSIPLSQQTIIWSHPQNTIFPPKDETDDGVVNIEADLICPIGGCHDVFIAQILLNDGTKIFKRMEVWRVLDGSLNPVWKFEEKGSRSEGGNIPIGQSIYNLTGNSNLGLDCSGINWYQQYNDAEYNWGNLTLNAKDMQWLAGYKLKADGSGEFDTGTSGKIKPILNIPSATDAREVFDSAKTKYARKYKQIAEQQSELAGIKSNIDKLYDEYTEGAKDKNMIARDVAAIREDIPFKAAIDREALFLQQISEDIEKVYQTTQSCWEEKTKPEYYDIYFKDEMQVLYCPLQFHGKMNVAPRIYKVYPKGVNYEKQRQDILKVIEAKPQKDMREIIQGSKGLKITRYVLLAMGPIGWVINANIEIFSAIMDGATNTTAEKYNSWLSHPSPNIAGNAGQGGSRPKNAQYMCWETSYEESDEAGKEGKDKKIPTTGDQCFGQSDDITDGQPAGAGKFAVERLQLYCKDFYKSTLSDYNELFGITQKSTTP